MLRSAVLFGLFFIVFILPQAGLVFAAQPEGISQLPRVQEEKTDAEGKPQACQDRGCHKYLRKVPPAKGKMILFNCHPEIRADTRSFVCASIRSLTGVDFRLPPAVSPKGRESVGFVVSDLTKDVQEEFLKLVHDPAVYVVPLTKDDLGAGWGAVFDRLVER